VTVLTSTTTEADVQPLNPASSGDFGHFGPGWRGSLRASPSFLAVLTLGLIAVQYALTLRRADFDDPDVWWHMRNAQVLLEQHHLVRQDLYSFTVAGHPWVNSEWLSEIPFYLAYRVLGLSGLKAMTFVLPTILMLLLLYLCYQESRNFKASVFACCLASFLAIVSYGPRTIMFGYILMVVLLIILQRFRTGGRAPLWIIPPLFCVWANSHGSWSLGMILFFIIGISGLFGGRWGHIESSRWTPSQIRKLAFTGAASVAALFLNPYGWRLVNYPFDVAFNQKMNVSHVAEWVSVNFQDARGTIVFGVIIALLLIALLRDRQWNLADLLMLLFALHTALAHIRFLVLLAIVLSPMLAKLLDFFPRYYPEKDTPRVNMAVMFAGIAVMLFFWPRPQAVQKALANGYPTGVVSYLKTNPPQGNVLNFYLWGGFIDWNAPDVKVFIDSRVDIFEYAGVFKDYLDLLGSDSLVRRLDPILQKYNIRYVLFPPGDTKNSLLGDSGVTYLLEHDSRWKVLYRDKVCVLMERVDSKSF